MCGIFGWISNEQMNPDLPYTFYKLLRHRGPDSQGHVNIANNSVIGMTRLSINDLSSLGNQPLVDQITQISLVFNGEIYNFKKIRSQLSSLGHSFQSGSDTEVVLRSYIHWGVNFIDYIEGAFAIAIWDPTNKKLLLARDRFGQKPLHYLKTNKFFAFSSEAKAILRAFPNQSGITTNYHSNFLSHGYVNNNCEIFENVNELSPGTIMTVCEGEITTQEYWNYREKFTNKNPDDLNTATRKIDSLLNEIIDEQIESSDVPVGVLLSGGIDSSILAKKALRIKPDTKLFTLGFKDQNFDESKKVISNFSNYKNQLYIRSIDYDINLIRDAIKSLDMPLGDTSVIPMYAITKFASQHVKTCLTGDGADEIFAGYSTYQATELNIKIPNMDSTKKAVLKILDYFPKKRGNVNLSFKLVNFLKWSDENINVAHQNWRRIFTDSEIYRLTGNKPDTLETELFLKSPELLDLNIIEQCIVNDTLTWLLNDILIKMDRVSMANSLELRTPFLDKKLAEYAAALPVHFKYSNFKGKKILKDLYQKQVSSIGYFSQKKGFGSPVANWIYYHPKDFYDCIIESNLYEKTEINNLFKKHNNRRNDNGQKIYTLFVFSLWNNQRLAALKC